MNKILTCSTDVSPRARFASSEVEEAPLAKQVGDISSCKSITVRMVNGGNGDCHV